MSSIAQALFAIVAALSAALGTPQDSPKFQSQAPFAAPAAIEVSQDITSTNSVEITGTIQSVTSTVGVTGTTTIVLDTGVTVTLGITTEVKGNLKPGMIVNVEGTLQPDGSVLASEIKPGLGAGDDKGNGIDKGRGDDRGDVITATMTITDDDRIGDGKTITGTRPITDEDGFGGHKPITGTIGGDNKNKPHDGDANKGGPPAGTGPAGPFFGPLNGNGANSGPHSNGDPSHTNGGGGDGNQSQDHPNNGNGGDGGNSNKGNHGAGKHGG
ncbi:MAG: DUF5666 domain-containing protein [Chloroflexi bacterium]|nr:DUF5666 domain-containing protein [Chloroflexota bacterium]